MRVSKETCIKAGKQQKKKKRKSNIYVQRRIVCFHGADWNKIYFFERKSLPKVCDHLKVKAAFSSKPSQKNKLQKLHYHYFPKKMHSLRSLEMWPKRTFFQGRISKTIERHGKGGRLSAEWDLSLIRNICHHSGGFQDNSTEIFHNCSEMARSLPLFPFLRGGIWHIRLLVCSTLVS